VRAARLGLLIALAILLTAPAAVGSPPPAQPWSPAPVEHPGGPQGVPPPLRGGPPLALAFASAGSVLALGTADARPGGPVPQPDPSDRDLFLFDFVSGYLRSRADHEDPVREGTSAVALAADGSRLLAGSPFVDAPNVAYFATSSLESPLWTETLSQPVRAVALSADGRRAAVAAAGDTGNSALRFYGGGDARTLAWSATFAGRVNDIDLSTAGTHLAAGGRALSGDLVVGEVHLYATTTATASTPIVRHTIQEADSAITDVDLSDDGAWLAAGTDAGRLLVISEASRAVAFNLRLSTLAPGAVPQPVVRVAISHDGARLAAIDALRLYVFERQAGSYAFRWSADLDGGATDLGATPDLEYLAVAGRPLRVFHVSSGTPLFDLDVEGGLVRMARAVDSGEVRLAAASDGAVHAHRLVFDHRIAAPPAPAAPIVPGRAATLTFNVTNEGSAAGRVLLTVMEGHELSPRVETPLVLALPGQSIPVNVTLSPSPGTVARTYRLNVTATSLAGDGTVRSAEVEVRVASAPSVRVSISTNESGIQPGTEAYFLLNATNVGNVPVDLTLGLSQRPTQGGAWPLDLSSSVASANPGATTTAVLTVRAPGSAANGSENLVTVRLQGDGVDESVSLRVVVNPHFGVALTVQPPSRTASIGRPAAYTLLVTNNGSLANTFSLHACPLPPNYVGAHPPCFGNDTTPELLRGWSIAYDRVPFYLARGQTRELSIVIRPPETATPGDRLSLQVDAMATNLSHESRAFVVVSTNVVEPPPTEEEERRRRETIPGPAAVETLAPLAAAAVVLLALRGRSARRP